jgi:hypothetical protein
MEVRMFVSFFLSLPFSFSSFFLSFFLFLICCSHLTTAYHSQSC